MEELREALPVDFSAEVLGPFHHALPAPMRVFLKLDGDRIVSSQVELGFLHRGLEKSIEGRNWFSAIVSADRLDSINSSFAEMALCLAVEELGNIQVPRRAQAIRIILCELNRVHSHLSYVAKMAQALGLETTYHYIYREKEDILDLFELLTGVRHNFTFFRYGGVTLDITDGFIERLYELNRKIQVRMHEYATTMIQHEGLVRRLSWLGAVDLHQAALFGLSGPNARASGVLFDVRKKFPYSGYETIEFESPFGGGREGTSGDCYDRLMVRVEEISESIKILNYVLERIPPGDHLCMKVGADFTVPMGEAFSRVESPRGLLGCYIVSSGETVPVRVYWRTPSTQSVSLIPKILTGVNLEDLPLVLASLDLSIAEVDK